MSPGAQLLLGIDLGGSAIKAGAVDARAGRVVGELESVPTPPGAKPDALRGSIAELSRRFPQCTGPVGFAYPGVVQKGVARTAANVDHAWLGIDGAALVSAATGRPGAFVHDSVAAGLAEMRFGAGRGERGAVMMLTFGTGIGSAAFVDGVPWPNLELGHLEIGGREAEHLASARVRTVEGLDWPAWCARVNVVLARYHALLWPDLFIIGGGVSERFEEFGSLLKARARIVPAGLRHAAGVVGAAMYAAGSIRP
jgi:polyphosphate glucokinase